MAKPTVSELSGAICLLVWPYWQVVAAGAQPSPSTSLVTLVMRMPTGLGYEPLVWKVVVSGAPATTCSVAVYMAAPPAGNVPFNVNGNRRVVVLNVPSVTAPSAGWLAGDTDGASETKLVAAGSSRYPLGSVRAAVPSLKICARNWGWSPIAQARLPAVPVRKQFDAAAAPVGAMNDTRAETSVVLAGNGRGLGIGYPPCQSGTMPASRTGLASAVTDATMRWLSTAKS